MGVEEISIPTTKEIEADGFITRQDDLEYTQNIFSAARLSKECIYPKCEECGYYRQYYCTVPMVVSKQIYLLTEKKLQSLEARLNDLENLVTDEILGEEPYAYEIKCDGYHKEVVCAEEVWCPDGYHIEVHDGVNYAVLDK